MWYTYILQSGRSRIACLLLSKKVKVFYTPWLRFSKNRYYIKKKHIERLSFISKISRNTTIACGDTEFEIAKK
jgi:ribosome-binding factor A